MPLTATDRSAALLQRLCLCAALLIGSTSVAAADSLPSALNKLQQRQRFPVADLSIVVREVNESAPLVSLNPDVPRNPASTIKLVTTWAALETFGPAYTWPTEVYALGPIRNGVLSGDLLIKGYGDPYMLTEDFWRMLGALRRLGLREIDGDLVLDASHFDLPPEDPGGFDQQPYRSYNVAPSALLVNFRTVHFEVRGASTGIEVQTDPKPANLKINNRIKADEGPCAGGRNTVNFQVDDPASVASITLSGVFPRRCGVYDFSRAVLTPESYVHGLFQTLWRQLGGTFEGGFRSGDLPPKHKPLLTWESRPLAEVIRGLNKWSNNTMARSLLLTLGADWHGAPGTPENGARAVQELLAKRGIGTQGLHIVNGSGLARETRISAQTLADMLVHAWHSPWMSEFISSLPIAGIDGTMRKRLKRGPETGRMHVKTGLLNDVSAVAGYVHGADGRTYVVVSIFNHKGPPYGIGREIHDTLLSWVYRESIHDADR
ncbi:MAG: D-alanyl-D-alanine carboxypeptidase/D-alanyl-D-alanine-endopeptidase [Gammaproteobacteria bacterium]|nr:D-alanyl-D-alanine carboxypeptidase/D-alanyl-D-alanine-endopeptidase [Gammaproteobacteria bacterium]